MPEHQCRQFAVPLYDAANVCACSVNQVLWSGAREGVQYLNSLGQPTTWWWVVSHWSM